MPTENWFPTPIFAHELTGDNLDIIQNELSTALNAIKQSSELSPWGDAVNTTFNFQGTNDIDTHNLVNFKSMILSAIDEYTKSIGYNGPRFSIYESWFNFSSNGSFQYDHVHAGSRISGVYYFSATEEDGAIRFQNPNPYVHFDGFPADGMPTESVSYKPKTGRLLLFPSWLTHRVNINNTTHERISIAINLK